MESGFRYSVSRQCRIPKKYKDPLLSWLKPFKRRPTPAELIAEACRKGSKLFGLIEPNHMQAAKKYRYERAQYILRHVEVVRVDIETSKAITRPVRAFIPLEIVRHGKINDYVPSARAYKYKEESRSIVKRAEIDFLAWLDRYSRYSEFFEAFGPVVKAFEELRDKLKLAG